MLGVGARQRRPCRAPPVMDQLTRTRFFFSGLVRPVLKRGPKSVLFGKPASLDLGTGNR